MADAPFLGPRFPPSQQPKCSPLCAHCKMLFTNRLLSCTTLRPPQGPVHHCQKQREAFITPFPAVKHSRACQKLEEAEAGPVAQLLTDSDQYSQWPPGGGAGGEGIQPPVKGLVLLVQEK